MSVQPVRALLVVVPAHDEEDRLGDCVRSIEAAAAMVELPVHIVVVLDDCSDGSAQVVAACPGVTAVLTWGRSVGAARARGVVAGLALAACAAEYVWIANTDADGTVDERWLVEHLDAARAGADLYLGAVVPRFSELDEARTTAWHASHSPGSTLGHVHGANLGVRADAYIRAGGFTSVDGDEDVELVARVRARGAVVVESERSPVVTSARLVGRVQNGYADYLAQLVRVAAQP